MKTVLTGLLVVLAAASTASAQSLLGDSGASPNDPPKRLPIRKRDHLQILIQDPSAAPARPEADAQPVVDVPGRSIAAEVVDIRPNGALVIQAILRRRVNGENVVVRLTGEVAAEAVVQNTVRCEKLLNLSVSYEGGGAAGGLFGKLWPF